MENQTNEIIEETKKGFLQNVTKEGVALGATVTTIILTGIYLIRGKAEKLAKKAVKIVEDEKKKKEEKKEKKD